MNLRNEFHGIGLCFNLLNLGALSIIMFLEHNGGLLNWRGFIGLLLLCVCCYFDGYWAATEERKQPKAEEPQNHG